MESWTATTVAIQMGLSLPWCHTQLGDTAQGKAQQFATAWAAWTGQFVDPQKQRG